MVPSAKLVVIPKDKDKLYNTVCRKCLIQIYFNNGIHQTGVTKIVDASYGQCLKALKRLKDEELIETQRNGRIKRILITDRGRDVVKKFMEINRILVREE